MAKKNKKFNVIVKVSVETELEISAESYEQALEKAREYNVKDVVDFNTPFNDGNISVSGIYDPSVSME